MKIVKAWEEEGVKIPAPFSRHIKVMLAPDKEGVDELLFSYAILPAEGKTDFHTHDRPELIIIVSGQGICATDNGKEYITEDMAIWCEKGEGHQLINTGYQPLKLATVFVPGFTSKANYERCVRAALNEK